MKAIIRYAPEKGIDIPWHLQKPMREYLYETTENNTEEALNEIYRQFNHVDGNEYISQKGLKERSLHIGDGILLNEQWYLVDFIGFAKKTKEEMEKIHKMDWIDITMSFKWKKAKA